MSRERGGGPCASISRQGSRPGSPLGHVPRTGLPNKLADSVVSAFRSPWNRPYWVEESNKIPLFFSFPFFWSPFRVGKDHDLLHRMQALLVDCSRVGVSGRHSLARRFFLFSRARPCGIISVRRSGSWEFQTGTKVVTMLIPHPGSCRARQAIMMGGGNPLDGSQHGKPNSFSASERQQVMVQGLAQDLLDQK